MPKRQKLLAKLLAGSKDIAFLEFISLLEGYGFELDRTRGSHRIYAHPQVSELLSIQPRHDGKAKPY
jgi:predicted RNA binding protein YcfA (HicA-like mRNA interferase family)